MRDTVRRKLILATTATENPMGAQRYESELIRGVPQALPEWSVRHLVSRSMRSQLNGDRRLPIRWLTGAQAGPRRLAGAVAFPDRRAILHRMDLVIPPGPGRNTVTIHDTVSWRYPDETPPVAVAAEEARRADAVICVSAFSAGEVQNLLGVSNPIVVYNGVDERFFTADELSPTTRERLQLLGPYVLHTGGAAERKNLAVLADAWLEVHRQRPDLTLTLCGPEHPRRTHLFGRLPGVRLLGRQPDELIPSLVKSAAVVVVPSTYEGFGLPALEAMAAGVPVVAANTSALPEVLGATGILVEPTAQGVRDGLLDALALGGDRAEMVRAARARAAEFTWHRCIEGHVAVWESLG